MSSDHSARPKSSKRRLPFVALTAVVAVSAIATVGIRHFFDRPGENALALVPSDALGVFVADLQPGPGQIGAFRKIASNVDEVDLGKSLDTTFSQILGNYAWVKEAMPHLRRSGVLVLIPAGIRSAGIDSNPHGIGIVPVTDSSGLNTLLASHLKYNPATASYTAPDNQTKLAIIQDDFVIGESDEDLARVRACVNDPSRSFASSDAYRSARKSIDSDANLMLFITSSGFKAIGASTQSPNVFNASGWLAAGISVRDDGLGFSSTVPFSSKNWGAYQDLATVPPVRSDLFNHLPSGAYAIGAMSDPAALWTFAKDLSPHDVSSQNSLNEAAKAVFREVGLDLNSTGPNALSGTLAYASYTDPSRPQSMADTLVVIDDSNGARPADIVGKLVAFVQKNLPASDRNTTLFSPVQVNGVQVFQLSPQLQSKWEDEALRSIDSSQRHLYADKTIAYATVGNAVIVGTSNELVVRGAKAYLGEGPTLSLDKRFASFSPLLNDSPQLINEVDVSRMSDAINSTVPWSRVPESGRAPAKSAIQALKAFQHPGTFAVTATPTSLSIRGFIPCPYNEIGKFVKDQKKLIDGATVRGPATTL